MTLSDLVGGDFDEFVNHGHEIGVFGVADGDVASVQIHLPNEIFGTRNLHLGQGVFHHSPLGNAPSSLQHQLRICTCQDKLGKQVDAKRGMGIREKEAKKNRDEVLNCTVP